jgi:hypothetical protein
MFIIIVMCYGLSEIDVEHIIMHFLDYFKKGKKRKKGSTLF